MHHQPEIPAISRVAPPSYEEATNPNATMKDNVRSNMQHMYGHYPEVSPYSTTASGYQNPNFYSGGGAQPASTMIYVSSLSDQQNYGIPVQPVVQSESTIHKRNCLGKFVGRFIVVILILFVGFIVLRTSFFLLAN